MREPYKPYDVKQPFYMPWPVRLPDEVRTTIEVDAYHGSEYLELGCTQLNRKPAEQKRIVNEWCDFFAKPTPIRQLCFVTRLPIPLFEAICNQTQLTALSFKWGPIKELSPISKLKKLTRLRIGSCSIPDLSPIEKLTELEHLSLENLDRLSDYSSLSKLRKLLYLNIEGQPFAPKSVWLDDLKFLKGLKNLRGLCLCETRIRDKNYAKSFAGLDQLEYLDLGVSGEIPTEEIISQLPALKYGSVARVS